MSATLKAFSALHYNTEKIKNLSLVVSPPYDVISKKELKTLRKKSPYNFSRVLLASNNRYKEIGDKFRKWIKDGILVKEKTPALYLYQQNFAIEGKNYKRFGILGLLRMDKKGVVFPHEYTLKAPKKDRSRVIKEVKANLSPIFVIAPKPLKILNSLCHRHLKLKPLLQFKDGEGIGAVDELFSWAQKSKDVDSRFCT